jgi:mono/diheme cytochrome c family protein
MIQRLFRDPEDSLRDRSRLVRIVAPALAAMPAAFTLVMFAGSAARAQAPAPDPSDIAEGMRLFRTKADCQTCHGWAADGRKMDTQMPDGANLRTSRLNRAAVVNAIKCGRPGTGMPAFDRLAYSDGRCYNMKLADLRAKNLEMPDPPSALIGREIDQIADFLFAKVIGKGPMTRASCIEYWGSEVEACKEFPQ